MTKVIRIEKTDEKSGKTTMTLEVDLNQPPPPEGWRRGSGSIEGNDACIIEDLLVRGLDSGDAVGMFSLTSDVQRRELSHDQDITGIIERCRAHGITVEPGEIIDDESDLLMEGGLRIFRGWRMTGEGCSWGSSEYDFMTREDGTRVCNVCGQEAKPR